MFVAFIEEVVIRDLENKEWENIPLNLAALRISSEVFGFLEN